MQEVNEKGPAQKVEYGKQREDLVVGDEYPW